MEVNPGRQILARKREFLNLRYLGVHTQVENDIKKTFSQGSLKTISKAAKENNSTKVLQKWRKILGKRQDC